MFKRFFTPPTRTPRDVEQEIASLCRSAQIEALGITGHLCRDVGLDCGCDVPGPPALPVRVL